MIVFESGVVRRLVGRLGRGDVIPDAFEALAREREVAAGWIRGLGAFEWVELCEYDQHAQQYRPARRIEQPCEVLSLEGNLSSKDGEPFAHVHVTVSRETERGIEVLGGHLVAARVFACEFSIEAYDDVELVRGHDESTGLSLWVDASGAAPVERGEAEPEHGISWEQVAAVSASPPAQAAPSVPKRGRRRGRATSDKLPPAPKPEPLPERRRTSEGEFLGEEHPERGDYIEHRQFGLCRVEGEDSEGGLRIRLPTGVRKVIRLEKLEVRTPRDEDGRRIFPVGPRRRR